MTTPTGIRVEPEIKQAVQAAAVQDLRSYTAELRYLITLGLAAREREQRIRAGALDGSIQGAELAGFMAGGKV